MADQAQKSIDQLGNLILAVREIRMSVTDLFKTLADSGPDPQSYIGQQLTRAHSNAVATYKIQNTKVPLLVLYVGRATSEIRCMMKELEHGLMDFLTTSYNPNAMLNEATHLALDYNNENRQLYVEMCKAYEAYDKLHQYASQCTAFLNQQSLRRIFGSRTSGILSKIAQFNPYTNRLFMPLSLRTNDPVGVLINRLAGFWPSLDAYYSKASGSSSGIAQITVNKVLKAVLLMRGIVMDGVIVKAYHESFELPRRADLDGIKPDGKHCVGSDRIVGVPPCEVLTQAVLVKERFIEDHSKIDVWSGSKYHVFRKLTLQADAALLHFQYPALPEIALRSFMVSTQQRAK